MGELECVLKDHPYDSLQDFDQRTKGITALEVEFAPQDAKISVENTENGLILTCGGNAKPAPTTTWSVNGVETSDSSIPFEESWIDTDSIICTLSNTHGETNAVQQVADLRAASSQGGLSTITIVILVLVVGAIGIGAIVFLKSKNSSSPPEEENADEVAKE